MKISIITPCFNSSKFIAETIESVVSQKGDFELEYFIIDGGSTDGTVEIVKKYSDKYPIVFISEPDCGMYDALAKGLKLVSGDAVGYINSDDFYFPGAFSVVSDIFKNSEIKWMTGLRARINEKGQTFHINLNTKYKKKMILKGFHGPFLKYIQQESTFFRKGLLDNVDFEKLRSFKYAGDYYLWKKFAENEELTVVEALIGGFRFREGQLSGNIKEYYKEFNSIRNRRNVFSYLQAVFNKFAEFFLSPDIKRIIDKKLIKYFVNSGWK